MRRTTNLSKSFPELLQKWNCYVRKFPKVESWIIASDYCLDDKSKPNNVMTFTIFPLGDLNVIKKIISMYLKKDIKDISHISSDAIRYLKTFPYFFSIVFIVKHKNKILDLETSKKNLESWIKGSENWPENLRKNYKPRLNKFADYLKRKDCDAKTLTDLSLASNMMSYIVEFLMIKTHAKQIFWISDRDRISSFQDGIIEELVHMCYASLINRRVPELKCFGFVKGDNKNFDYDELVRIPDYISGAVASVDFDKNLIEKDKHQKLFDEAILDNERIFILEVDVEGTQNILSQIDIRKTEIPL